MMALRRMRIVVSVLATMVAATPDASLWEENAAKLDQPVVEPAKPEERRLRGRAAPDEPIAERPGDGDEADEVGHGDDQAEDEDDAFTPFLNASNFTTLVTASSSALVPSESIHCNGHTLKGDWKPKNSHGIRGDWQLHMTRNSHCHVALNKPDSKSFKFKEPVVDLGETGVPPYDCGNERHHTLEHNKCLVFYVAQSEYKDCHVLVMNFHEIGCAWDHVRKLLEKARWTPHESHH